METEELKFSDMNFKLVFVFVYSFVKVQMNCCNQRANGKLFKFFLNLTLLFGLVVRWTPLTVTVQINLKIFKFKFIFDL